MSMRVLVSAASRHGSTAEVATEIASVLAGAGLDAGVASPDDVHSLDGWDAAVIGSAIYVGHWLAPARDLVERLAPELAVRPVWLFSSGPVGDPPAPDEEPEDVVALVELVHARGHQVFAGRIDRKELGLGEKVITAALRVPEGDFRPWTDVRTWAEGIARDLVSAQGADPGAEAGEGPQEGTS
ncbi:MAG: flavodoxin domain-containing protein [Chloroflexi bacterium]|jgi:menaquinone-dependent protoporphyrinogen oxidase|nr:flavodoxin domain-containing protein [Chloroflexota bacterium]